MSNNKQLLTIKKFAKVLPNQGFQQEPGFTSKGVPNGKDFHSLIPQGEKRLDGFSI